MGCAEPPQTNTTTRCHQHQHQHRHQPFATTPPRPPPPPQRQPVIVWHYSKKAHARMNRSRDFSVTVEKRPFWTPPQVSIFLYHISSPQSPMRPPTPRPTPRPNVSEHQEDKRTDLPTRCPMNHSASSISNNEEVTHTRWFSLKAAR